MMWKVYLILIVFSLSSLVSSTDDDFAEFDDIVPDALSNADASKPNVQPDNVKSASRASQSHSQTSQSDGRASNIPEQSAGEESKTNEDKVTEGSDSQKKPDLKLANVPSIRQFRVESYYIEITFLLATFLYLINFFVGSAKNLKFAQDWYEKSRDQLKQQFVLVGGTPTLNEGSQKRDDDNEGLLATLKKQKGLIKSSESLFTVWNSGRVGMDGLLVEINLIKRQDLFSMALTLFKATRDTISFRFLLGNQDGYENFVFCLAQRAQAAKLSRDLVDINTFCPKRKPLSQMGVDIDKLVVMSELTDVATFILDQKTKSFLKKYERSINYIHITDQCSTEHSEELSTMQKLANPKRIATFSFAFPLGAEQRSDIFHFSLSLLDRLRKFKLARDGKQKSEKNRQKITEYLQKTAFSLRQEAVQAKKEELRRLERERIYNEDDPEKQKRWEKKEAKREQKKSKVRVKQLKVKSI